MTRVGDVMLSAIVESPSAVGSIALLAHKSLPPFFRFRVLMAWLDLDAAYLRAGRQVLGLTVKLPKNGKMNLQVHPLEIVRV